MNAASRSSLPPPSLRPDVPGNIDEALAEAFAASEVLMPPPPDEGAIPEWHLATDVKPLRPLPRDLADTVRQHSAAPTDRISVPRVRRARRRSRATTVPVVLRKGVRREALRVAVMLLTAVLVGTVVGALCEHVVRYTSAS